MTTAAAAAAVEGTVALYSWCCWQLQSLAVTVAGSRFVVRSNSVCWLQQHASCGCCIMCHDLLPLWADQT